MPRPFGSVARGVRRRGDRTLPPRRPLGAVRVRPADDRPRADPRLRAGLRRWSAGRALPAGPRWSPARAAAWACTSRASCAPRARWSPASTSRTGQRRSTTRCSIRATSATTASSARRVGSAYAETGRLDCLVNAAGVLWFGRDRSLLDVELEVWNRVIAINLTGCMLTARHAIPLMRKTGGGAMVHFSSTQCLRGDDRPQDAYQVSKAGILALSKSIAIQFARDGIRSNVILPSATESPMQARWNKEPELKAGDGCGGAARPGRHHGGHGARLPVPACPTRRPSSPAPSCWSTAAVWPCRDWSCRDRSGLSLELRSQTV